jgi:hypothetical protein
MLLRGGGDRDDGVAAVNVGALDADVVVRAAAEVVDRGVGDAVLVEPLDEFHVAGTLAGAQVPRIVPEMHLGGGRSVRSAVLGVGHASSSRAA